MLFDTASQNDKNVFLKTMKTVCIDVDGTISHYIEWVDSKTFGEVLPHCAETIHHLKADGWYVIIYTTRADIAEIGKFLEANNIPFDAINENPNQPDNAIGGKPIADVYVDDRAIQFDGDWVGAYQKITGFKAWEEGPIHPIEPPLDYCGQLLIEDFSQSMEMHRHYDSLNWQITKFAFGEILIAIGACWTVFSLDFAKDIDSLLKWYVMGAICVASWLFGILSIYTIVKNRVYFVRTARHINELRHHVLQRKPYGFSNESHFWEDPAYPKVRDFRSTQYVSFYILMVLTMTLAGVATYCVINILKGGSVIWIVVSAFLTFMFGMVLVRTIAKEEF